MFITLLEIPIIVLYSLTSALTPKLEKLILWINKHRRRALRDWGKEDYIWDDYNGEENKYVYVEKQVLKINLTFIGFFVSIIILCMIFDYFGIPLDLD